VTAGQPVLRVQDLTVSYGQQRSTPVVHQISFDIGAAETLALVGESGSGKSTTGLAAVGLLRPVSGRVLLDGSDLAGLKGGELRRARAQAHMVFQNPSESLNPRRSIGWSIAEPLRSQGRPPAETTARVDELLNEVGLGAALAGLYPHELSGGQRQRVGIARALASRPRLVVCDEPTSALDVSVQAQIINLLLRLQADHGTALLFISHDLAVVESIAHRVAVMRQGRIVEAGPAGTILAAPQHPYTQTMLASVPTGRQRQPGDRNTLANRE
jgi:ABC-type glutathione transport system ATPase component